MVWLSFFVFSVTIPHLGVCHSKMSDSVSFEKILAIRVSHDEQNEIKIGKFRPLDRVGVSHNVSGN